MMPTVRGIFVRNEIHGDGPWQRAKLSIASIIIFFMPPPRQLKMRQPIARGLRIL
jgi:hypothetical protein